MMKATGRLLNLTSNLLQILSANLFLVFQLTDI